MRRLSKFHVAGVTAISAVIMSSSPAMANRCGNSLPVDAPTKLVDVARKCNVNLSELYEANPGVDPGDVRPGEHLAIPDERERGVVAAAPAPVNDDDVTTSESASKPIAHPIIASYGGKGVAIRREDSRDYRRLARTSRGVQSGAIRVRDVEVSEAAPSWLRANRRHNDSLERLSFQARSKLQLAAATNTPRLSAPIYLAGDRTIECPDLRDQQGGKIHQVKGILATDKTTYVEVSERADGAYDCTLLSSVSAPSAKPASVSSNPNVPAAVFTNKIVAPVGAALDPAGVAHLSVSNFSLQGEVVAVSDGCLILRTERDEIWRLAAAPPSGDLLGKNLIVWGTAAGVDACGAGPAMVVSHAVYAEPM